MSSTPLAIKKKYTVFIPCYNAEKTVAETIVSVQKAITEMGVDIPVYVYDDCSKDASVKVANETGSRQDNFSVIENAKNSGERKTTNAAFKDLANSFDWAFVIHADDIVKKDWLTTLIGYIEQVDDKNCFTVWSSFDTFFNDSDKIDEGDNSGVVQQIVRTPESIKAFLTRLYCNWHISGAAINVALYHTLNGFDERMAQFGDTDFFVKGLLAGYTDVYISRTLTLYRVLQGSVSSVSVSTNRDIKEAYMLMEKYKGILNQKDIGSINRIIRRLSFRRMIKSLKQRNMSMAVTNLKYFSASILK